MRHKLALESYWCFLITQPSKLFTGTIEMMSKAQLSECAAARVWWKVTTTGRFQLPPDNANAAAHFIYAQR
jgi:hypothetical protein